MLDKGWLSRLCRRPAPISDWQQRNYLAVDLELTGLSAQNDSILSLGWVAFNHRGIHLATAQEVIVREPVALGQSPVIHGLTQHELNQGLPLCQALSRLTTVIETMSEAVLVFHHAALDWAFLTQALRDCQLSLSNVTLADTLATERYLLKRKGSEPGAFAVNLTECRARYGLEAHPAHSALEDALATAELMLHQCHRTGCGPCRYRTNLRGHNSL